MFFAVNRQILMNLLESWTLLFANCWIQTTSLYYMYVGQPLHRSSFHSANSHCLRNLSQKRTCLHKLFALLSAKNGAPPLGPTKCATKGAGKSKERDRILWIESRFARVEAVHYTTNRTHHINLTSNIGLHVSGLSFGFSGPPCSSNWIWILPQFSVGRIDQDWAPPLLHGTSWLWPRAQ